MNRIVKKMRLLSIGVVGTALFLSSHILAQEPKVSRSTWQAGCGKAVSGKNVCQIQRDIRHGDGKDLVSQFIITREVDKKDALIRWLMPLDVNLPYGVRFAVTTKNKRGQTFQAAYQNCAKEGCWAVMPLTDTIEKALRAGATMQVSFVSKDLRQVEIGIDLNGFTKVHDAFVAGPKS